MHKVGDWQSTHAEKLSVMEASGLFNMQVLTRVPLTGVQAQNGKLRIWFGCVYQFLKEKEGGKKRSEGLTRRENAFLHILFICLVVYVLFCCVS